MARRGITIVFTLLGVAFVLSFAGFVALYLLFGREPAVPANAILTLTIGGDLAEIAPADVVSYRARRRARRRCVRSSTTCARRRSIGASAPCSSSPPGFSTPFWAQGAGDPRRGARLPDVGQADLRVPRIRRRPRLLPGQRRRQSVPHAVEPARSRPASPPTKCSCAGRSTSSASIPDLHHIGDYKTASNTFTEKGFTAAHREMDASLNRDLYDQIVRGIAERRKTDRSRRAARCSTKAVPARARAARRTDRRDRVRRSGRRRSCATPAGARRADIDGEDYARVSAVVARAEPRPAHRRHLRRGRDHQRHERLRSAERRDVGSDTLIEAIRQARKDASHPRASSCASTARADRRPPPTRSGAS